MARGIYNTILNSAVCARRLAWIFLGFFGMFFLFFPQAPLLTFDFLGASNALTRVFGFFILLLAIDIFRKAL